MSSAAANPFSPRRILALLLVGASAFLLFLYALGAGWTGDDQRFATAHADANGLNGFSALVGLLERRGHDITITRDKARGADEYLLVLTPGINTDPAELQDLIEARRFDGPTLVILPKWIGFPLPDNAPDDARDDWVQLNPVNTPMWLKQVEDFEPLELAQGATRGWRGLGLSGNLPDNNAEQAITEIPGKQLFPLVTDTEDDVLAGYWNRGGYHPDLAAAAGVSFSTDEEDRQDENIYPLVVVADPDLMNNYGMADRTRAQLAVELVELSMDGRQLPIVFDMTMAGYGNGTNLLTLAFQPPFLAATLCLLLAMFVIGWRAFRRFGPPLAEAPAMAHGKTQLARNGASLIARARRWHLLGPPYAALVAARVARSLGIRETDEAARERAIDAAMTQRGLDGPQFSEKAHALRSARRLGDMVRAAGALRTIERTLIR